jgi:Helix-turn-helix domain
MNFITENVPSKNKIPPLHARLFWYRLTSAELALLKAMVEHCWDGSDMWPSIKRLSAYSKLDERTVQNLIHGWDQRRKDPESGEWITVKHNPGLLQT